MKVLRYPLGNSLFAYVNTRAGKTLINIRHFKTKLVKSKKHPKGIKKVVPSSRGITLDIGTFHRLLMISKNLCIDYHLKTIRLQRQVDNKNLHFAPDEDEIKGEKDFNNARISEPSSSSSSLFHSLASSSSRESECQLTEGAQESQ